MSKKRFLFHLAALGSRTRLFAAGAGVAACMTAVAAMAPRFASGLYPGSGEVGAVTAVLCLAGLCFLPVVQVVRRGRVGPRELAAALAFGAALRAVLFLSAPILEDDWRRYLWDGAVVAAAIDPYEYPPAEGLGDAALTFAEPPSASGEVARLVAIGEKSPDYPERINHPYLTSIYPPAAQAAFFLANRIAPFSLAAWRLVLALADIATLTLLFKTLSAFGRSRSWALLYWLNPLVVFEIYNAAHMDALLGPFLVLAMLWAQRERPALAGAALAVAAGVKIWPVVFVPIILRRFSRSLTKASVFAAVFAIGAAALLAPFVLRAGEAPSGLAAYAAEWRTNAFVYSLIEYSAAAFSAEPERLARILAVGAVLAACAGASLRQIASGAQLSTRAFAALAVLVFISPTGYPWYAVWLFILWPLAPVRGFAILAASLPLYHFRFFFQAVGESMPLWLSAVQYAPSLAIVTINAISERFAPPCSAISTSAS